MPQAVALLQAIIDAELAVGNSIVEVSSWPPNCELVVILKRKFWQPYSLVPNLTYRVIDDCHYWYAEYDFNVGQQILACGFEQS